VTQLGQVGVERDGHTVVVWFAGEMDVTNSDELIGQAGDQATNDVQRLILDLSGLQFLDSSGIRALVALVRRLSARGTVVTMVVPEESPIRRILEITRMEEIVPLFTSRAGAAETT